MNRRTLLQSLAALPGLGWVASAPAPDCAHVWVTSGVINARIVECSRRCLLCGVAEQLPDEGLPGLRGESTPGVWPDTRCPLVYRSPACGVERPTGSCDKSAQDCQRNGNLVRFGGVRT